MSLSAPAPLLRPLTRRGAVLGLATACLFEAAASAAQAEGETPVERELTVLDLAGHKVLASRPAGRDAPLLVLLHGLGPPASPRALSAAVAPRKDVVSLYVPLPFSPGAPDGGPDELPRRQAQDYGGALVAPLLAATADRLPRIIEAATQALGLSPDRPAHLFGFSLGGAAALAALSRSEMTIHSVVTLNAPLSMRAAVRAYEKKLQTRYTPPDPSVLDRYDLAAEASRIAQRQPQARVLLAQAAGDELFQLTAAQGAARALQAAGLRQASAHALPAGGHNDLASDPKTQAAVARLLAEQLET